MMNEKYTVTEFKGIRTKNGFIATDRAFQKVLI